MKLAPASITLSIRQQGDVNLPTSSYIFRARKDADGIFNLAAVPLIRAAELLREGDTLIAGTACKRIMGTLACPPTEAQDEGRTAFLTLSPLEREDLFDLWAIKPEWNDGPWGTGSGTYDLVYSISGTRRSIEDSSGDVCIEDWQPRDWDKRIPVYSTAHGDTFWDALPEAA